MNKNYKSVSDARGLLLERNWQMGIICSSRTYHTVQCRGGAGGKDTLQKAGEKIGSVRGYLLLIYFAELHEHPLLS